MTSRTRRQRTRAQRWSSFAVRTRNNFRRMFERGEFAVLLIAVVLLLMPILALQTTGLAADVQVVIPIMVLSMLFGFVLSYSAFNEFLALMLSMIYGSSLVLLIAAWVMPGDLGAGVYEVLTRSVTWMLGAIDGTGDQDDLVLTLLVATLFWFLGYNAAWHLFRYERVSRVITPPGTILIANVIIDSGDNNLIRYLIVYIFLSLLLIVRANLNLREWQWYTNGIRVAPSFRPLFNAAGTLLAFVVLFVGWATPLGDLQQRLDRFQEFMQAEPLVQFSEMWNRLFSTIDAYGPITADYYGGDSLQLSGALQLGDQVVMQVEAPPGRRYYWRSRVFDTYQEGNWSSQASVRLPDTEIPFTIVISDTLARDAVQQRFSVGVNASRLIYTAPQPASIDQPVRADLRYTIGDNMNIYVIRPFRVLKRGTVYTATSMMSNATSDQLRGASEDYPEWVRNTQLYVPPTVTGRTVQLAQDIVTQAGAVTPYDKAKAIERWLRTSIAYNENIPQPPSNQDPIDWFLFDHQEGYCNYYASSMVMMLRSQGIPARMGAGFAQGTLEGGVYVVRERDAHTWVEVYFPGYGWIEFEPTAAQAPLDRGDTYEPPTGNQPSPTPIATNTPTLTPTATPTLTATPTPEGTLPPAEDEAPSIPTITPTLTPTATATAIIIPTPQPPAPPPTRSPLSFIVPALLTALIGLLILALLVAIGVFIWWWWEWRGMRGMSPVVRAYARMERYVTGLLRLPLSDRETPNERRGRIINNLPKNANRPISAITKMYVLERYGRGPENEEQVARHATSADKAWKRTRENILSRYLRRVFPFINWFRKEI